MRHAFGILPQMIVRRGVGTMKDFAAEQQECIAAAFDQLRRRVITLARKSPYLTPGRLADVLAALQIMAAGQRPEGTMKHWADQLSGWSPEEQIARWTT